MPYKKAAHLQKGDLIRYPSNSKVWSEVYNVGRDARSSTDGNIYVAIEKYGNVSFRADEEVEVKD